MKRTQYILLTLTLIILLLGVTTVFAKKKKSAPPPTVTVISRWTPQEQLTTGDDDGSSTIEADELRKVNLQMSARSDRQFWAMDISCEVNIDGVFETSPVMTEAGGWHEGTGTTFSDVTTSYFDNSVTPNRINATFTRVGASNSPMGLNGTTYTEFLFNLELTLTETLTGTNLVSITCDKLSFVDRNGESLGTAVLDSTNNLTVSDGYVLSGSAARQGNSDQTDIEVSCEHMRTGNTYVTDTKPIPILNNKGKVIDEIQGQFSFSKDSIVPTDPLRDFGLYKCSFTSKLDDTEDRVYLQGTSYINLQTPNYRLQPIILRSGDTNIPTPDNIIDVSDFTAITANWQNANTIPVTPFTQGDVNGDGFANELDLAITAGNVGLQDNDDLLMDHVIYSVARDYNGTFPNNSLVIGDVFSGDVSVLNSDRVFWPQVSPDGSQVAFYGTAIKYFDKKGRPLPDSKKAVQTVIEEGILVGDTTDFGGTLIAGGKNFAPSWSPSGNKIAYVCSWDDFLNGNEELGGYEFNNGNICIVNASGGSIQTIIPSGALSSYAEIFPPAWYDETTIVYAGNGQSEICPDQLCYYDMLTNTHGLVDIQFGVNGSNTFANMPVIIRKSNTLSYLFYRRFDSSNDSELRMGPIIYSGGTWSGGVLTTDINTATQHEQVDSSDDVHYYDVSPMLDVMFYGFGDTQFHNRYFDGSLFSWTVVGEDHIVDGFIGYPTVNEFLSVWDGYDEGKGTDFHAFRATFDWIP